MPYCIHAKPAKTALLLAVAAFFFPGTAAAHVKWFADFSLSDRPATLAEIVTPALLALAVLSMVAVGILAIAERRAETTSWFIRLNRWLAGYTGEALLVLRVTMGATLLLLWQQDAILAPELHGPPLFGWLEFVLALLLLFRRTVPLSGLGLLLLYGYTIIQFGLFHMLDYLHFAGIAWYFIVATSSRVRLRESRIPALYLTVGFSLCWLALEKLVYPQWTLYILSQNPQLVLGLDADFFRVGAAFVELTLGYLFLICLFERPTAALVTVVFFLTTTVFGKVEVIGHTALHGALIVFLLEGPGRFYRPPIKWHRRLPLRTAFASVNFALLLAAGLTAYQLMAWQVFRSQNAEDVAQKERWVDTPFDIASEKSDSEAD
jgi:hypothetical protein